MEATGAAGTATCDVAVIILTYNEAPNIEQALASVCGWAREVVILDSFSTDETLEIARSFPVTIVQHRFEDFAKQRNYALADIPVAAEWIFFLDADEWLPDAVKREVAEVVASKPAEN